MTNKPITPSQLSNEMKDILRAFQGKVSEAVEIAARDAASEAVAILKTTSPKNTGKYAKSWSKKKLSDASYVIYNKNPNLPHLLENSHEIYSHGQYLGFTKPIVHIKPAEEKAIARFEELLKQEIEKG